MNLNFWTVLCVLVCVGVSEALKEGDTGVCPVMKNVKKIKSVPATQKAPCLKGERPPCHKTVNQTKSYFAKEPGFACCKGYEWIKATDSCKPVCSHGCVGGSCVAPGVCACAAPLILDGNKCTLPVCDHPCVNGKCTAHNTCTCNDGYLLQEDNFTCSAQCTNCENGGCAIPNVCECNEGFFMIENKCTLVCDDGYELINNTCRPVCSVACVNGNCVAPNKCECLTGFKPKEASKEVCEPKCDSCSNGDCEAPNKCTCHEGYSLIDNICTPTCEDRCVNANCVAPNKCECFTGFKPKLGHEAVCMPKCDSCANGECVSPNKCVCSKGYKRLDNVCRPTCKDTCVNGNCTAPNICTCKAGYKRNATEPSICQKPCSGCNMGTCTLEGECVCDADSKLTNGTCLSLARIEASGMEATSPGLASLETSWLVGGAVGVLLVVLVIVVINRMWRRNKDFGPTAADDGNNYGSVIYTLPDTLIRNNEGPPRQDDDINESDEVTESDEEDTSEKLMATPNGIV